MAYIKANTKAWTPKVGGAAGGDVFRLLSAHPETNPQGKKSSSRITGKNDDTQWVKEQEATFMQWINDHLKQSTNQHGLSVGNDLRSSLQDGLILIELMKIVAPESIQFIKYHKNPRLRLLRLENVQIAFECMKREGIQLLNIEPSDIVDGNLKLTLGLLQTLANRYPIMAGGNIPHKTTTRKSMLQWLQAFLPKSNITNLTSDWNNGILLCKLIDKLRPGLVPDLQSLDSANRLKNTQRAMNIAERNFDIPQVANAEALCARDPEEIVVASYLSYFCGPESPGHDYMIDWVNQVLLDHPIINFTSDWQDGTRLCYFVSAFCSLPDEEVLSQYTPVERVKVAMEAAEMELNIISNIRPSQFISKTDEQLQKMAYIAQFMKHQRNTSNQSIASFETKPSPQSNSQPSPQTSPQPSPQLNPQPSPPPNQNGVMMNASIQDTVQSNTSTGRDNGLENPVSTEDSRDIEENLVNQNKRKSKLDELFEAMEADFASCLHHIQTYGNHQQIEESVEETVKERADEPNYKKESHTVVVAVDSNSAQQPSATHTELELDFDFDFSSDTATSSEVNSRPQSVSPDPVAAATRMLQQTEHGDDDLTDAIMGITQDEEDPDVQSTETTEYMQSKIVIKETVEEPIEAVQNELEEMVSERVDEPAEETVQVEEPIEETVQVEDTVEETIQVQESVVEEMVQVEESIEETVQVQEPVEEPVEEMVQVKDTVEETVQERVEEPIEEIVQEDDPIEVTVQVKEPVEEIVQVQKLVVEEMVQVEEPVEETVQERVEEHIKETVQDDKPIEITVQVEEPVKETIQEQVEEPIEETVQVEEPKETIQDEEPVEETVQEGVDEPVEETDELLIDPEAAPNTPTIITDESSPPLPDAHEEPLTNTKSSSTPTCNPQNCKVSGRGLYYGIVNKPGNFIVDCSNSGQGRLEIIIESPTGENLDAEGEQIRDSVFRVCFTPSEIGTHKIFVLFDETDVPSSPFSCEVCDPSACYAMAGDGLVECSVGNDERFQINTAHAGPGTLQTTFNGEDQPIDFHLTSCIEGVFTYHYMVHKQGVYEVEVKWVGEHIPGSPFKIIAKDYRPNSTACIILEQPFENIRVRDEIRVRVDCQNAGFGELKALLQSPRGEVSCDIQVENNVYTVSTRPSNVGDHQLVIQYGGEDIPDSPIGIHVNDPSRIKLDITPMTPQTGSINKPFIFYANTDDCGQGGSLSAIAFTSDAPNRRMNLSVELTKFTNKYCIKYIPKSLGIHSIQVLYDNKDCLSTPISLRVHDVNSVQDIVLTKTLPAQGTQHLLNKLLTFQLSAPNRDSSDISFTAVGLNTNHTPYLSKIPTTDSNYSLEFKASKPDDYKISVTYKGEHVQGSPFTLPIRSPVRANKVTMYDPVIPLVASRPIELVFDTSQAGHGVLSASVLNSKKKIMPVYVEQVDAVIYRVAFIPKESGSFMVSVLYADKHIGGSPFRVLYQEQKKDPLICIEFKPEMNVKGLMGSAVYGRNSGRQEATVVQYERGKYQISFQPQMVDTFDLHVYWFDSEIEGSPFEIDLLGGMENESSDALVDSVPIVVGDNLGMLAATSVGHSNGPVPIKLTPIDDSICTIEFTSPSQDKYDLNIFWNNKILAGMPIVLPLD